MADLTSAGVTIVRSWPEGAIASKDKTSMLVQVVLSSMGTATNAIPASAFGLTYIEETSHLVKSDDTQIVSSVPSYDLTKILLDSGTAGAPGDYTGTYQFTLSGY